MYSAADLEPLLFSSSAGDEKRHMLLPHCPLVSGYALEVEPNFSFLVSTESKKKKESTPGYIRYSKILTNCETGSLEA